MRLGPEAMEKLQAEVGGRMIPGDEVVIAGPIALSGTAAMAAAEKKRIEDHFSPYFQRSGERIKEDYGVPDTIRELAEKAGAGLCMEMREGFLAALWKASEASDIGLSADLRRIPIRQETVEIAELLERNPYELESAGAWLISVSKGILFAEMLRSRGYMAAVIGEVRKGRERILHSGSIVRYLDRPARKTGEE